MSGGVDSSVTAALLAEAGPRGGGRDAAALRPWRRRRPQGRLLRRPGHPRRPRPSPSGWASPTTSSTSRRASSAAVIDDFATAYAEGRTPIPCVRCNQRIKFRDLLDIARDLGADALATGHYVRRVAGPARARAAPRRRPGQGPELLPVRHHRRRSSTSCASRWASSTRPRPAPTRVRLGLDGRRQARQPGHLLRARRAATATSWPGCARTRSSPATSSMSTAACSAAHDGHRPLHRRPAARPRASPTASGSTWSASSPPARRVVGRPRAAGPVRRDRARRRQLAGRAAARRLAGRGQAPLQRARRRRRASRCCRTAGPWSHSPARSRAWPPARPASATPAPACSAAAGSCGRRCWQDRRPGSALDSPRRPPIDDAGRAGPRVRGRVAE